MGAGYSSDKATNINEALNKSTTTVVNRNNVACAASIEQVQKNILKNIDTSKEGGTGGNISLLQDANLISKCVLESTDKKKLIDDIANDIVQEHTTDKGAAGLFTFASTNVQENIAKVTNELTSAYESAADAKCDLALYQEQRNELNNIKTGGGNITIGQTGNINSACSIVSNINTEVSKQLVSSVSQSTATTIPSIILYIVIGVVVISVIGAIVYYMTGDTQKRRAGLMANFPRRPPPQYGGPPPQSFAPLQQQQQQPSQIPINYQPVPQQ